MSSASSLVVMGFVIGRLQGSISSSANEYVFPPIHDLQRPTSANCACFARTIVGFERQDCSTAVFIHTGTFISCICSSSSPALHSCGTSFAFQAGPRTSPTLPLDLGRSRVRTAHTVEAQAVGWRSSRRECLSAQRGSQTCVDGAVSLCPTRTLRGLADDVKA